MPSLKLTWSGLPPGPAAEEVRHRAVALVARCSEYDKALGGAGLKSEWRADTDTLEATLRPAEVDPGAVARLDQIHAILLSVVPAGGPAVAVTRPQAGGTGPG